MEKLGVYNLYAREKYREKRDRGQFFSNEYQHIANLRIFGRGKGPGSAEFGLLLGAGYHQIDSDDQEGFFNPAAQQSFLHNTASMAQSFHNMPKEGFEGLAETNGSGMILFVGGTVATQGALKLRALPIHYAVNSELKTQLSQLKGASYVSLRANATLIQR